MLFLLLPLLSFPRTLHPLLRSSQGRNSTKSSPVAPPTTTTPSEPSTVATAQPCSTCKQREVLIFPKNKKKYLVERNLKPLKIYYIRYLITTLTRNIRNIEIEMYFCSRHAGQRIPGLAIEHLSCSCTNFCQPSRLHLQI